MNPSAFGPAGALQRQGFISPQATPLAAPPGPQPGFDPDALGYLARVESADGAPLEPMVRAAVCRFVAGCKAHSVWGAVKAACILMGARTLAGALTPLVGAAPTNFNFVSGDYNRTGGLTGNGATKYLNSNRNCNEDPALDSHVGVFFLSPPVLLASGPTANTAMMGGRSPAGNSTGSRRLSLYGAADRSRNLVSACAPAADNEDTALHYTPNAWSFHGVARNSEGHFVASYAGNVRSSLRSASATHANVGMLVFALSNAGTPTLHYPGSIAFYSAGTFLDMGVYSCLVSELFESVRGAVT